MLDYRLQQHPGWVLVKYLATKQDAIGGASDCLERWIQQRRQLLQGGAA
jgi:regulator of sigma D